MTAADRLESIEMTSRSGMSAAARQRLSREANALRKQLGVVFRVPKAQRMSAVLAALANAPNGELTFRGLMKASKVPEHNIREFLRSGEIYVHRRRKDPTNKLNRTGEAIIRARAATP